MTHLNFKKYAKSCQPFILRFHSSIIQTLCPLMKKKLIFFLDIEIMKANELGSVNGALQPSSENCHINRRMN